MIVFMAEVCFEQYYKRHGGFILYPSPFLVFFDIYVFQGFFKNSEYPRDCIGIAYFHFVFNSNIDNRTKKSGYCKFFYRNTI